jgi:hypothetical protein
MAGLSFSANIRCPAADSSGNSTSQLAKAAALREPFHGRGKSGRGGNVIVDDPLFEPGNRWTKWPEPSSVHPFAPVLSDAFWPAPGFPAAIRTQERLRRSVSSESSKFREFYLAGALLVSPSFFMAAPCMSELTSLYLV